MRKKFLVFLLLLMSFLIISCGEQAAVEEVEVNNDSKRPEIVGAVAISKNDANDKDIVVDKVEKETPKEANLSDAMSIYEESDPASVIKMYLQVSKGNKADGSNHTWSEINSHSNYYYDEMGIDRYMVEGKLKIVEADGTETFGALDSVPNVSVQVRGQTSSENKEKNYKVRIKDGKGEYRNQRTLNLNKHVSEPYRFINKVSYDLLNEIPQLIGGRTQFVDLYVCDTTDNPDNTEYVDYGLYTMVEQVNKTYLKNRGLDENGHLYKVSFFEWNEYEAISTPSDSPEFDEAAFEKFLEIKGDRSNKKLNEAVEAINNYMRPIDEVVEEYFDAENISYWMAYNILIGNYDSGARNLFLYSPLNSNKFYMVCWDMDAAFRTNFYKDRGRSEGGSWERGMSMYLGLTLTNRMLKEKKYRDMLDAAVEDLHNRYINQAHVQEKVDVYSALTRSYMYGGADSDNAYVSQETFEKLVKTFASEVEDNYKYYKESRDYPWPFFTGLPELDGNKMILSWDISYDINGKEVTYDYILAEDYNFENVVSEGYGLVSPSVAIDLPEDGTYYLKLSATNSAGYTQDSFDYYVAYGLGKIYGCYAFEISEDGTVEVITE